MSRGEDGEGGDDGRGRQGTADREEGSNLEDWLDYNDGSKL